jgi:alkylation response protein AidB-like acyl-CoA dehydrogenase
MATMVSSGVTTGEWVERARSLASVIETHRDESEHQRHMARPIFDAIADSHILQMLFPAEFGGAQAGLTAQMRVIEEIAGLDGAAGWNVMIGSGGGLFADYLPEETAHDIFAPDTVIAGAIKPIGQARPVPGGFEVSGRWSFASGCHYANWLLGGCVVMENGAPRMLPTGMPETIGGLMPAADCRIVDTWHTAGLRGTGSHDFRTEATFVPAERTVPTMALFRGPTRRESTAYPTPFADIAAADVAAVGLGIARDAIETFKQVAVHKTPTGGFTGLASQHTVQERVGRAEALLRSARAYLYETVQEVTAAHAAGAPVRPEDTAAMRLAGAYAAEAAVKSVDIMFDAAGGTSIYESSRLERCFRDVHMVTHHIAVAPSAFEMVGQFLLGGPLEGRR